jgi:hypothetical protein
MKSTRLLVMVHTKFILNPWSNTEVGTQLHNLIIRHFLFYEQGTCSKPLTDNFGNNRIYQLKCNDCALIYVGQTGRAFRTHFREYRRTIRSTKQNSRDAQYVLQALNTHDTIQQTMEIRHIQKKRHLLNTLERSHVCNRTLHKQQRDGTFTGMNNLIFDIIIKTCPI